LTEETKGVKITNVAIKAVKEAVKAVEKRF
jgi:hypothetical protein